MSLTMPKFYFYRSGESDRDWIERRMRVIPPQHRQAVADEYERIYLTSGRKVARKLANTYLHTTAKQYRDNA